MFQSCAAAGAANTSSARGLAAMEINAVRYRISEVAGWVIVTPSVKAENKSVERFGVWEVGVLTSFKREVDQRVGVLWLCHLNPQLKGYFHDNRFAGRFEIYHDLLFSADSVLAGGTLSYIAESGSVGDYLDSLARLRCFALNALYPGHGRISDTPIQDIERAMGNAQALLGAKTDQAAGVFYQDSQAKSEPVVRDEVLDS